MILDMDLLLKWLCVTQIMGPRTRLSPSAVTDADDMVNGLRLNLNSDPGHVLGSLRRIRASLTAGVQATPKIECSKMSSDLGCCWGYSPAEDRYLVVMQRRLILVAAIQFECNSSDG